MSEELNQNPNEIVENNEEITENKEERIDGEGKTNSIIRFENATITQGRVVLSNINLEIAKGEFVYLIGKTGSGKSSLLKTIYADIPLTSGIGMVCDMPLFKIKKKNIPLLRRKLGIVFQDFQLLQDRNIFDNVAFVLKAIGIKDKNEIQDKVTLALESVGMDQRKDEMPYKLSEGEMQRVAIARAIVNQPEIIIADEPTGNLDPITSEEIVKLLLKINQENNTSILMVTHDYLVVDKFRFRVICCEDGKLIA
mgnify:CR=1 FL=1|jgi:cell division transport system ATP-binding protein